MDTGYFLWDGSRLRRFDYQGDTPLPFVANGLDELLYTGSFGHLSARSPL